MFLTDRYDSLRRNITRRGKLYLKTDDEGKQKSFCLHKFMISILGSIILILSFRSFFHIYFTTDYTIPGHSKVYPVSFRVFISVNFCISHHLYVAEIRLIFIIKGNLLNWI